jgi:hypothetical protein
MAFRPNTRCQDGTRTAAASHQLAVWPAVIADEKALGRVSALIAALAISALMVRRWLLIGHFPPGLDGAQWLALGRGFHGVVRSTEGAYAPLFPLLATAAEALLGPLPALRFLAIASGLAVALATWLVARDALGPLWGMLAAGISIPASALAEPLMYGGYPQQFALAAGIVAIWGTCRYLIGGDRRLLFAIELSAFLAAAAHHIYFPVMLLSIVTAILLWLSTKAASAQWRLVRPMALALAPACGLFAVILFQFASHGYQPPLQASERTVWDAWLYATREAPLVWLVLLIAAIISLALLWRSRGTIAWLSAASLILPAACLFLVSGQPRLLPPVLLGTAVAIGLGAKTFLSSPNSGRQLARLAVAAIAIFLLISADRATAGYAEFYRVIDRPLIDAAATIERDGGNGAIAVREDRRGWPIGWWFEALLTQPVIVGSDPQWLGFPGEQEHAHQAAALFDGGLDPATFATRAAAGNVGYLVISKWDWIGWERWLRQPGFPVAVLYDDDRYLVLRVTRVTEATGTLGYDRATIDAD